MWISSKCVTIICMSTLTPYMLVTYFGPLLYNVNEGPSMAMTQSMLFFQPSNDFTSLCVGNEGT